MSDEIEFAYGRNHLSTGPGEVAVHIREQPTPEAKFALGLIERWGLVAGKPDGEDAAGRAKLALLPPDEMVERAFDSAKLAYEEMRKRGLTFTIPSIEEIRERAREEEKRN